MGKIYKRIPVELTLLQFNELLKQLQEQYNKDYELDTGSSNPPLYSKRTETTHFFGYEDREKNGNTSLYDYMIVNERVLACLSDTAKKSGVISFNPKHLYLKYRKSVSNNPPKKFIFSFPYNHIFFEYLNLEYDKFIKSLPSEIANPTEKKEDKREFYLLALKLSEQRIDKLELHIQFNQQKLIIVDDKGEECGEGTVKYAPDCLEIQLDRMDDKGRTWIPSTAHFKWEGKLKDIRGIAGTYSGIASKHKRTVAASCVIIEKEHYEESKNDIAQYLFLRGYAVDVKKPIYEKGESGGFLPFQEDRKILQEFVGETEVYIIDKNHIGTISQYVMEIEPELFGFLYSPHDRNKYLLAMRASSNTISFNISHLLPEDGSKYATNTSLLAVDRRSRKVTNGGAVIYQAATTGMNRDKNWIAFPVLLVVNPPNKPDITLIKKKNLDAFLNVEGREELNKEIIKTLYEMETSRLELVDNMLGDILSDL